jgi:hypothetical protein
MALCDSILAQTRLNKIEQEVEKQQLLLVEPLLLDIDIEVEQLGKNIVVHMKQSLMALFDQQLDRSLLQDNSLENMMPFFFFILYEKRAI